MEIISNEICTLAILMKIFVESNDCTIERLLKMFRIAQLQIEYILVSKKVFSIYTGPSARLRFLQYFNHFFQTLLNE